MKRLCNIAWKKIGYWSLGLCVVLGLILYALAWKPVPEKIQYGMSFNTLYARELGLDWRQVYDAMLYDLDINHLRLAAHWPMVEGERNTYNFSELDYQVEEAKKAGADVVLAIGRRLPRWPECHVPEWATELNWEEQKDELREYLTVVVERYRDEPHITYWQVENEPYLEVFAYDHCGDLDETFLQEEVDLVRSLDDTRPILVTDSGNLGTWSGAYKTGDVFGTSVYLYFWNPEIGQFRTFLPPWFYRAKDRLMRLWHGPQETMLIELAAEPWLVAPVTEVPIEQQLERMNLDILRETVAYAEGTRFEKQYLWGGEWWFWLRTQGHPELWEWARDWYAK